MRLPARHAGLAEEKQAKVASAGLDALAEQLARLSPPDGLAVTLCPYHPTASAGRQADKRRS